MMLTKTIERILKERPELTYENVMAMIKNKLKEFRELINLETAAIVVASELGIPIEKMELKTYVKIKNLIAGISDVSIQGRLVFVRQVKTYQRLEREGKYVRGILADDTGFIDIVFWDKYAELIEKREIKQGETIEILHAYTRENVDGKIEVHVSSQSEVYPIPDLGIFPKDDIIFQKIGDITEKDTRVNLVGVVDIIFPLVKFRRVEGEGKVLRLKLYDNSGRIYVVAWDNQAENLINNIEKGASVKVINGKVRKGLRGLEVHIDEKTCAFLIEKEEVKVRKPFVPIGSLNDNQWDLDLLVKILHIDNAKEVRVGDRFFKSVYVIVGDSSGMIPLLLRDEQINLLKNLKPQDIIVIENCHTRLSRYGILELVLEKYGSLTLSQEIKNLNVPDFFPLNSLKEKRLVCIEGNIDGEITIKEVPRKEPYRILRVAIFTLRDATGSVDVILLGDLAEAMRKYKSGDRVRVSYLRVLKRELELKCISTRYSSIHGALEEKRETLEIIL